MAYDRLQRLAFDMEIIPETLWQASQSINMALVSEKVQFINKVFPEYFAENKELLFRDMIKNYNDDPGRYKLPKPMNFTEEKGLELAGAVAGTKSAGAGGSAVDALAGEAGGIPQE